MRYTGPSFSFSTELQTAIWGRGHTGSLLVWEHPGQGRVYLSLENPDTGAPDPMFLRATLGMIDSDNDGMDDGWELWHFGELVDPNDDADNDGLSNLEEYLYGTDPNNPDTSGDGLTDGQAVALGLDPRIPGNPDAEITLFTPLH